MKLRVENITPFDISLRAIAGAKKRFPKIKVNYVVANLFNRLYRKVNYLEIEHTLIRFFVYHNVEPFFCDNI
ncbi:hypothetical protein [Geminocystis sp. GBBB08]|uniref:hypothetical protein n=1 Tax=Geminocystis sp. GBBB08 TaxID=2604140 RepID=UPI0027E2A00A|nr:hypothetical protein [Geminocystis sp. GBBB08]MBL1210232.1 hypothetical protein [Geminocystis sp. GBBB08]